MLIPKYWAEAREQYRASSKKPLPRQITLRRLGWSDISQEDAQRHAEQRVRQAMQEVLDGKVNPNDIARREKQRGYNGADGVPIREEAVYVQGENVITRNAYGALCLNTPDVMFIDFDIEKKYPPLPASMKWGIFFLSIALVLISLNLLVHQNLKLNSTRLFLALIFVPILFLIISSVIHNIRKSIFYSDKKLEEKTLKRLEHFVAQHPNWLFNVYRTFAGYRILVLHKTFDPKDKTMWQDIESSLPDPTYVLMCRLQNCFRARLTPKPWRLGMKERIQPQKKIWNIEQADMPERLDWIAKYEAASADYSVCHFIKQYGTGFVHPKAEAVRQLHDDWCKVHSHDPLA